MDHPNIHESVMRSIPSNNESLDLATLAVNQLIHIDIESAAGEAGFYLDTIIREPAGENVPAIVEIEASKIPDRTMELVEKAGFMSDFVGERMRVYGGCTAARTMIHVDHIDKNRHLFLGVIDNPSEVYTKNKYTPFVSDFSVEVN